MYIYLYDNSNNTTINNTIAINNNDNNVNDTCVIFAGPLSQ